MNALVTRDPHPRSRPRSTGNVLFLAAECSHHRLLFVRVTHYPRQNWFYYGPRRNRMCSNLPDREHDGVLARLILSPANPSCSLGPAHLHILTGGHHPGGYSGSLHLQPNFMSWVQNRRQRFSPTRRLPVWVVLSPACLMTGSAVADTVMAGRCASTSCIDSRRAWPLLEFCATAHGRASGQPQRRGQPDGCHMVMRISCHA